MIYTFGHIFTELSLKLPEGWVSGEKAIATQTQIAPGGRTFNQAVAAARMGAKVSLIGVIGEDLYAKDILQKLAREGIAAGGVARSKQPTGMLTRLEDTNGRSVEIVSTGANAEIKSLQVPLTALNHKTLLMLQDEAPIQDNIALLRRAKDSGAITFVSLRGDTQYNAVQHYADYIIARDELDLPDAPNLVRYIPDQSKKFDAAFAEDCFCGALAACLQAGLDFSNAYHHAQTMAHLAGAKSALHERFPYLDDVLKNLPELAKQA